MKINLILPKTRHFIIFDRGVRLYFLAGPIQGGDDWQARAIALLAELDPNCYVACPCRYTVEHPLFQYSLPDNTNEVLASASNTLKYIGGTQDDENSPTREEKFGVFPDQTTWERYYLEFAAEHGSVVFWLSCEDKENPRNDGDPYARDTYGEIARWSVKSAYCISPMPGHFTLPIPRVNLIVDAEKGFPGLSVIQRNFDADHRKPFQFHASLEETIKQAVSLGKKTNPKPLFNKENC